VTVHPPLLVYVITLVPADTPVTRPVLFTVATPGDADTHGFVAAGVPDPVNCVVCPIHAVSVPLIVGSGFTVTVAVTVHPPLLVYVITLVPADTPVTRPVLFTVATPGDADTHGFVAAGVPDPVNCVVCPIHTVSVPVIVGSGFTVTVAVTVHPPLLVYVITLVPADTPVTRPVLFTVATPGDADTHGFVAVCVPDPVNCVFYRIHTVSVLVIVGPGFTVTVAVTVHPPLLVYVITLVPADTPVTRPVLFTVATPGDADTHGLVAAGVPDPVSCVVCPIHTVSVPVIVGSGFTVTVAVTVHPPLLVYVITDVPADTPVTRPVLFTVATPGDADTHGFVAAGVPDP